MPIDRFSVIGSKGIKRLRENVGMGQEELAVWVGLSVEDLQRYGNGVVIPERDAAMLAALAVPVAKVQLERVC